jgi:hypothetical protein
VLADRRTPGHGQERGAEETNGASVASASHPISGRHG